MQNGGNSFFDSIPPITKNLIIINALIWLLCLTLQKVHLFGSFDFYNTFTLHYWEASDFKPIQIISYMFLHDRTNPMHIFFNMFNLYMFGKVMEQVWGPKRFITFYFTCGIGAAIVQEAVWSYQLAGLDVSQVISHYRPDLSELQSLIVNGELVHSFQPQDAPLIESASQLRAILLNMMGTIGASGAIFGLMLGFAMTFPDMPLYFMFIPIPVKAKYMIGVYALFELIFGLASTGDGIAHYAHIGGMIFGIILILIWRKEGNNNRY